MNRRAALAAAPALLLAGCGADTPGRGPAARRRRDIEALERLLAAHDAAPAGAAGAAAADRPLARAVEREARAHRATLERAIGALGGRPPADDRPAPPPFSPARALVGHERVYAAYLAVVPRLADGGARELCAGNLAELAATVARLRVAVGRDATPEAFVT